MVTARRSAMVALPLKGNPIAAVFPAASATLPKDPIYRMSLSGSVIALYPEARRTEIAAAVNASAKTAFSPGRLAEVAVKGVAVLAAKSLSNLRRPGLWVRTSLDSVLRQGKILWSAAAKAVLREQAWLLPVAAVAATLMLLLPMDQPTLGRVLFNLVLPGGLTG